MSTKKNYSLKAQDDHLFDKLRPLAVLPASLEHWAPERPEPQLYMYSQIPSIGSQFHQYVGFTFSEQILDDIPSSVSWLAKSACQFLNVLTQLLPSSYDEQP